MLPVMVSELEICHIVTPTSLVRRSEFLRVTNVSGGREKLAAGSAVDVP